MVRTYTMVPTYLLVALLSTLSATSAAAVALVALDPRRSLVVACREMAQGARAGTHAMPIDACL